MTGATLDVSPCHYFIKYPHFIDYPIEYPSHNQPQQFYILSSIISAQSRFLSRQVRRQLSIYVLEDTSSAHISVKTLTCVKATINICSEWHLPCAHVKTLSFWASFLSFWASAKNLEDTFHVHYRVPDPSLRLRLRSGWQQSGSVQDDKVRTKKLWHPPCAHVHGWQRTTNTLFW